MWVCQACWVTYPVFHHQILMHVKIWFNINIMTGPTMSETLIFYIQYIDYPYIVKYSIQRFSSGQLILSLTRISNTKQLPHELITGRRFILKENYAFHSDNCDLYGLWVTFFSDHSNVAVHYRCMYTTTYS